MAKTSSVRRTLLPRLWWQLGSIRLVAEYVIGETAKRKRSFSIGLLTVFLTVAFLSLIQNIIDRASVIFIKFSEDSAGQWDLLLSPTLSSGSPSILLNYTVINTSLSSAPHVAGAAPRWILPGSLRKANQPDNPVYVMAFDYALEKEIGLGSSWPYRDLKEGEISVTASLLQKMRVKPNSGERMNLTVSLADVVKSLSGVSSSSSSTNSGTSQTDVNNGTASTNPSSTSGSNPFAGFIPASGFIVSNTTLSLLPPSQQSSISNSFPKDSNGNVNVTSDQAWAIVTAALTNFTQEFTVVDAIKAPHGKYPSAMGNVAIMGLEAVEKMINDFISGSQMTSSNPDSQVAGLLLGSLVAQGNAVSFQNMTVKLREHVTSVIAVMKDRMATYSKQDQSRKSDVVRFSNEVATNIGLGAPVDYTAVLLTALEATSFMQIFLGEVLLTVIIVLLALAILLIFSLLLTDVEDKTFEYGMLRSLGMRQRNLINLLFFQSLYFSVPAILIGLLVSYVAFIPISYGLSQFANIPLDASLSTASISLGVCAGILLPLLGMILPTRRALGKTLRDALDVFRTSINDVSVRVEKLEKLGLSPIEMIIALVLIVVGFLVYYIVPLSFVFQDLQIFFRIMTIILLGMLLGAILLGQVLQHWFEVTLAHVIVRGVDKALVHIVCKNLAAHRRRNNKTTLIFTLCLAYIVFASTMFTLQATSLRELVEWQYGADILVTAPEWSTPLPEQSLRRYLDDAVSGAANQTQRTVIKGYTFATFDLNEFWAVSWTDIYPLVSLSTPNAQIYGLEPNFLSGSLLHYYMPDQIDQSVGPIKCVQGNCDHRDVVEALTFEVDPRSYLDLPRDLAERLPVPIGVTTASWANEQFDTNTTRLYRTAMPVLVSKALEDTSYVDVANLLELTMMFTSSSDGGGNSFWRSYLCKPIAFLKKLPSFTKVGSDDGQLFISMQSYERLLGDIGHFASVTTGMNGTKIPLEKLLVTVSSDATDTEIGTLANDLTSVINNDQIKVAVLKEQVKGTTSASTYIMYLFYIVAIVGLIFCFFVLWLSFSANIRENSWEFGVLRAIGFSVTSVQRVYIYEAVCIILSCAIIGTTTGVLIALAVALQFNLFTSLPFSFTFPLPLYCIVLGLSFAVSVAGSYLPSRPYAKEKIASVLKGR
ncbi:uncharacterized protein SPPG_08881 [Spizellomyces punctatus DAOM BR117]|uniref:ABC3 transporter permease C-terminal domain-containing protein n=1 Tax=Spizellomyces punctatus (strain DAOM BR117) TaxID=645134 RepID=A0A0L0HVS5_SPIPD|nr:uncharacterized protein SPPG_08881 [Spizellomyces punctatus DAOM BR117]KND05187.1 hypothetical protein SPPG_08881 [Spizellomyces punctatus DAOM BR117]|eukprot:XP_016613226.1 hypothetical protein SPPG_08881 [Spizellomyces punctatus DAOM BR117]